MIGQSFTEALGLLVSGHAKLIQIILLSLGVSGLATLFAALIGVPAGGALAVARFPGRRGLITCLNAAMGLPPVVIGLMVYLLLSRAGPLGPLGILFTPSAMVVAQVLLIAPIMAALARQIIEDTHAEYREQLDAMRIGRWAATATLVWDARFSLITVVLAGFGRAMAEVGAVMIVGGNIDGVTRTMTTTIALETSKGDLPLALALGMVLLALVLAINAMAAWLKEWAVARYG